MSGLYLLTRARHSFMFTKHPTFQVSFIFPPRSLPFPLGAHPTQSPVLTALFSKASYCPEHSRPGTVHRVSVSSPSVE